MSLTYKDAGVDIEVGDSFVERIKPIARTTLRPEVLTGIGGFGALTKLPSKYEDPILVSSTDGVGTKLKLAFEIGKHDTVGIDLVAMSVNDVVVQGAEPLFFLDYFACGQLDIDVAEQVISGIAKGCRQAGCALIGGETAEMPGMYPVGEYDLAGFCVGVVERSEIITGENIVPGDVIIGLNSSGLHSNGYSLVRKVIDQLDIELCTPQGEITEFARELLTPTRIYVKSILSLMEQVEIKGIAHITGGGIVGNIQRILPDSVCAKIATSWWERPSIFNFLQEQGSVGEDEMYRVFNCGIGMIVVVSKEDLLLSLKTLSDSGEQCDSIGWIEQRKNDLPVIILP